MVSLDRILTVKTLKLDAAKKEFQRATELLRQRTTQLELAQKEFENHRLWRISEEARQYKAIMGQPLQTAQLDKFRSSMAAMHEDEASLKLKAIESEKLLQDAIDNKESCHRQLQHCLKGVEKYEQLIKELHNMERAIEERLSEETLDEFLITSTR
ncbi:type III secretion system stalk subunit SctO [Microbulbifer sp. JMSA003]|uniref:type III secretion system stalk subunit SctO n=1 Tax=unclassified Microbulbifer TaxID=2619833 RepID=UPI00403A3423